MTEEIINCYELDLKQDIPAEMELIKSSNENLKNSNRNFKIILLSIGLGVFIWYIIKNSKPKIGKKKRY